MKKRVGIILGVIILLLILGKFGYKKFKSHFPQPTSQISSEMSKVPAETPKPEVKKNEVTVENNDIWDKVGKRGGLDSKTNFAIYDSAKSVYDLAKIKAGNQFYFYPDTNNQIYKIVYAPNNDEELIIEKNNNVWTARMDKIQYEVKEKVAEGTISDSLYADALKSGYNEQAILAFAEGLEYNIDFANDPRVGDKYKFIYEERYRDGKFANVGRVLAGAYLNDGKLIQTFYFKESEDNEGLFDVEGHAIKKKFLKAPLAFKYISSPFTTGRRYIEKFNTSTGHRAVDYAAAFGTPIRAVGDGTVIFAARNGPYGNMVKIRHDGTYTSQYGHMSKFAVKRGAHVTQGQVIGYVGSTGFSTGPHLHFEMVQNGVKINPASVVSPPGKPISQNKMPEFLKTIEAIKDRIKIN